ncbi:MAG: NAD-dependent epimerase/dehydratase family protein [Thermodesulfobacteriota bacterium]
MKKLTMAIVGCGAVSERCHIPAMMTLDTVDVKFLVDNDIQRARQLANKFKIASVTDNYHDVIGGVDAAIIALPHHLHEPVGLDMLNRGVHVLVEKPMAMTTAGCRAMLAAAKENDVVLAVGHMRRFLYAAALAKEIITSGMLGAIESIDAREGNVYNWPVHSDFFFRPEKAGGGVLLDTGSHTLDLLIWWMGDVSLESYLDDNYGGVEADCFIHLKTASGARGEVELSRTRNLRNTAIIEGQRGKLEIGLRSNEIRLSPKAGQHKFNGSGSPLTPQKMSGQTFSDLFVPQITDFVQAVQNKTPPKVPGAEAARTVTLIEECYRQRGPLTTPGFYTTQKNNFTAIELSGIQGKTVLVSGATGFIGGRLVERLVVEYGAKVKVLVRNFKNASRIARFPVEMIPGDVIDRGAVSSAAEGCRFIFHCAYDFGGSQKHREDVAVSGTENVCRAAIENHVDRLVHISTFSVYGDTPDGDLNEDSTRLSSDDPYTQNKQAAEDLVLKYTRHFGLPAVIIQPTIVYGPYSKPWTIGPVDQLQKGRVALVDNGQGVCNAVYIDDVIQAMLLAATKEKAIGEVFLISGKEPISWKEFYHAFEQGIGSARTIFMTDAEIDALRNSRFNPAKSRPAGIIKSLASILKDQLLWEKIYNIPGIKIKAEWIKEKFPGAYDFAITKILGLSRTATAKSDRPMKATDINGDIIIPDLTRQALLRSRTRVCIDRAQKILGYQPQYSFEDGMALTREFLKWGNYLS